MHLEGGYMKRIVLCGLAAVLLLTFTACYDAQPIVSEDTASTTTVTTVTGETVAVTDSVSGGSTTAGPTTTAAGGTTTRAKPTYYTKTTTARGTTKSTAAKTTETTRRYIVDTKVETKHSTKVLKYGVVKKITQEIQYYVYSDGAKVVYNQKETVTYDNSGYTASDADLMQETLQKSSANMQYYNEVLTLVNQIRAAANVPPLTLDVALCQAATMRTVEMNYSGKFDHTRPDGTSCFTALDAFGVNAGAKGENIAAGHPTPAKVVEGWKNSSGHYANMVHPSFTKLGVGMSNENIGYGIYWAQLFTN